MTDNVLILGATSGIGAAIARRLASEGASLLLAGRRLGELERDCAHIRLRYGASAQAVHFEALDFDAHGSWFDACCETYSEGLTGVVLCHGEMSEQSEAEERFELSHRMIDVNYTSAVSLLSRAASYLESRGSGWICAVSSVAGDRGRRSNHLYGSSKAALSTYLQGLRARLAATGVPVVTVKPGFVDTGLTYGRPGMFLVAEPDRIARDAVRGVRLGRGTVYSPWFWVGIMALIRAIPEPIFKRLNL